MEVATSLKVDSSILGSHSKRGLLDVVLVVQPSRSARRPRVWSSSCRPSRREAVESRVSNACRSLWRQNPSLSVHVPYGAPRLLLARWPRRVFLRPRPYTPGGDGEHKRLTKVVPGQGNMLVVRLHRLRPEGPVVPGLGKKRLNHRQILVSKRRVEGSRSRPEASESSRCCRNRYARHCRSRRSG